jgi:hypothetical protein
MAGMVPAAGPTGASVPAPTAQVRQLAASGGGGKVCTVSGTGASTPDVVRHPPSPLEVAARPSGVTADWLPGLNATAGDCTVVVVGAGPGTAGRLASAIDHAPAVAGSVYFCPMDDGTAVRLAFAYAHRPTEVVSVALRGCRFMTGPGAGRRWLASAVVDVLRPLAPAAWDAALSW